MTPKLPTLTFRWKMLLAMMLVVTTVAGAALLVTQRAVAASYDRLFQERFRSELEYFSAAQQARLAAIRDKCLELARSVRLIAALEESDVEILYSIAYDELRDVISMAAPMTTIRPATFFRILDAEGRVIAPPDGRAGLVPASRDEPWLRTLSAATRAMPAADKQGFGYLELDAHGGGTELHEVVLTRIVDAMQRRKLGALAIGFRVPDAETGKGMQSALRVSGRLHSRTLSERAAGEITRALAGARKQVVDVRLDGAPHRVLSQSLDVSPGFPSAEEVSVYSLAEAYAEQAKLARSIAAAGALGLLFALLASLRLSRSLSVPIEELVEASGEVRRGNYDVKVEVRAEDEIGVLARSFNRMVAGLRLKDKYRNYLDLLTDREVAAELSAGKEPIGGEVRDVSVLFCDIRGFTSFTERMHPAEVIHFLNEQMTAFTAVVHDHHGVVDKFVGDLIMAQFGAPTSYGNDALNAVRCAAGMIEARRKLNATTPYKVEVGIGIASGNAVAGWMGSNNRLNYTVLGERVNLASRLCSKAGRMEIIIDETTRERIAAAYATEPLPALELKGFSAPMPAYRVAAEPAAEVLA